MPPPSLYDLGKAHGQMESDIRSLTGRVEGLAAEFTTVKRWAILTCLAVVGALLNLAPDKVAQVAWEIAKRAIKY